MTFLNELGGNILQRDLAGRRYVVEIGVLDQRIETVVLDRPVGVANHCFAEATVIERAEGAFTLRVI